MSNANKNRIIVGLDIGTSKVVAIVGEINPEGRLEIIGLGSHGSKGLKKGVVVNIESTVQSIQRAIEEAELMAGCQIQSVYAGIAGSHIRSMGSHGSSRSETERCFSLTSTGSLMQRKRLRFPLIRKSFISCLRNSSLIPKKGSRSRWGCLAFGWRQRCIW